VNTAAVCAFALTMSVFNGDDKPKYVIDKEFFGIKLGEPAADVLKRCKEKGLTVKSQPGSEDVGHVHIITGGCLKGNDSIAHFAISTYKERVGGLQFFFKDFSPDNYEIVKKTLEKKYGEGKASLMDILASKLSFIVQVDGHSFAIQLDHDINFGEDSTLILTYAHMQLANEMAAEIERRKMAKVEDDM